MKMECSVYNALCEMEIFVINGKNANSDDFGEKFDHNEAKAEDYCCGDMRFDRKKSNKAVLKKYKITEKEYSKVCDMLEDKLSFGCCGWCS